MSCRIRKALGLSLIQKADRKMRQRRKDAGDFIRKPLALVASGVIFASLVGFTQPVRAATAEGLFSHSSTAGGYSVLRDFVQTHAVGTPAIVADAATSATKSSAKDDVYSALIHFGQVSRAPHAELVVARARTRRVRVTKGPAMPAANAYATGDPQVCLGCHGQDPHIRAFLKSPMARKGDPRTPMAEGGCETCHGPAAAHVASRMKGGNVFPPMIFSSSEPVAQRNAVCLGCHQTTAKLINWQGSQMQRAGVACTDCHTVMAAKDPVLVRKTQPQVCFKCHADIRAQTLEYSHHPIREGRVVCSDCHNPMGSAGPHLLKEFTVNETCYNCHPEKRGPFLFEHQPVRENCLNCHTPHGSTQARLLKEPLNFLCGSCHSATADHSGGAFGGANSLQGRLLGAATYNSALANNRLCLNCHSQVHGSNSPGGAYFFR